MKLNLKPHNQKGRLITFCGLDGCGKTTQINLLKAHLELLGENVVMTKQPSDSIRNLDIFRNYQEQEDHHGYNYPALSLLCASDRLQHSNEFILPLLERGFTVISDRYYYSCVANLRARGYRDDTWIYDVSKYIPKPDLAVFLDVDADLAMKRVHERPEERNLYIDADLQHKLREEYISLAKDNSGILLSSEKEPENTARIIYEHLKKEKRNV